MYVYRLSFQTQTPVDAVVYDNQRAVTSVLLVEEENAFAEE